MTNLSRLIFINRSDLTLDEKLKSKLYKKFVINLYAKIESGLLTGFYLESGNYSRASDGVAYRFSYFGVFYVTAC